MRVPVSGSRAPMPANVASCTGADQVAPLSSERDTPKNAPVAVLPLKLICVKTYSSTPLGSTTTTLPIVWALTPGL